MSKESVTKPSLTASLPGKRERGVRISFYNTRYDQILVSLHLAEKLIFSILHSVPELFGKLSVTLLEGGEGEGMRVLKKSYE